MKHLTDEERLALIEGRAGDEAVEHAKGCAECSAQLNAMRRSIQKLERFDWPVRSASTPRRIPFPALRWAAAAALAICAGFAAGKLSAPNAAEIKAQLATELRQEMSRELQARFANVPASAPAPVTQAVADNRAILALLAEIREQQAANYLSLRTDLETLASTADARLQSTRRQIMELASVTTQARKTETEIQ
jgi:hypothetical protein